MVTGWAQTIRLAGLAALALIACLALAIPAAAAKKKGGKKKGGGPVNITKTVNAPIPDKGPGPAGTGLETPLSSTIDVGKQAKGLKIDDVNVTLQTLGTSGVSPGDNLVAILRAPNGANTFLFNLLDGSPGTPNLSIGPLTLDDEAPLILGIGTPNNSFSLFVPWLGSAIPDGVGLWVMDNGPVRGTWTLDVFDDVTGETNNLVSWSLNVRTRRAFQTK